MALDFNCGSNVVTGFSRNNPRERGQERECLRATTSARGRPTGGEITGENLGVRRRIGNLQKYVTYSHLGHNLGQVLDKQR